MSDIRPDPDALLRRVQLESAGGSRGKLKVFLGAAPGVGKTYTMLEETRKLSAQGVDVVVGYVEPHVRPETAALVLGLDILPPKVIDYRGLQLRELDLDAALRRKATVLIVDELAHTNAPGCLHVKRWQDVEELLDAGISVYTTLNVQHIESLNDVVAQVTGVIMRETVPDSFLDQADQIELVDLPPEDLLERLKAGKIYLPQQAEKAFESFFRKENLIALRELALRRAAERVGAQLEDYRKTHDEPHTWPTTDRLLVCVSPSPFSARLVRATRRMAAQMRAPWIALYIDTPRTARMTAEAREQLSRNLRLAEELGAEIVTLGGENVASQVIDFARSRNVTKIVVGKPLQARWREALFGSFVYDLTRQCGEIDVYVISGDADNPAPPKRQAKRRSFSHASYAHAVAAVAIATGVCFALDPFFEASNLVLMYLLAIVAVAARGERGPSVLASMLSVLAFDVFFVPPRFSFAVSDVQYIFTFAVMLAAALLISGIAVRFKLHAEWARRRENATAALYGLSHSLAAAQGIESIVREAARQVSSVFEARVAFLLPGSDGMLAVQPLESPTFPVDQRELAVAQWVLAHAAPAGLGTETLPSAGALYLPLVASGGVVGVIGIQPVDRERGLDPERRHLLETFTNQAALAIERAVLSERARASEVQVEAERLRNSLLSAVSHDLRTPLASIMGSSSTLLEEDRNLPPATRKELMEGIYTEAERLNRLVGNLLYATRLEAGAVVLHREWQPLEEIVGVVLNRLSESLERHPCTTSIPPDLPLVFVDQTLIEQVLFNLVDNATCHTPTGTSIEITAEAFPEEVRVAVADHGPGLAPGDEERVFARFQRGSRARPEGGTGLGLTVAKGIVTAHGGRIWAENHSGGGAVFRFTLPLTGTPPAPPSVVLEDRAGDAAEAPSGKEASNVG